MEEARNKSLQSPEKKDENGQTTLHHIASEYGKLDYYLFLYLLLHEFQIVKIIFMIIKTMNFHIYFSRKKWWKLLFTITAFKTFDTDV